MTDFKYEGKDLEAMSFAHNYHRWILSKFQKFLGKRVAEVGAGSGNFSLLILGQPIEELVAIEPSPAMFSQHIQNTATDTRVKRHNAFFPEISPKYPDYFDSIVYVNVMEHVEKDAEELSHVHQSLKKGGRVCIFVPALAWLYSNHDKSIGHYRRYHKKDLIQLLEQAGFEVEQINYFDIIGIIPWLIICKFLGKEPNTSNVSVYDRLIVPIGKFIENIIPPPIGKNLLVVGRKKI